MSYVWNTYNPTDGSLYNTFTAMTLSEVDQKLRQLVEVQIGWEQECVSERCEYLIRMALFLKSNRYKIAEMMAQQMGKPITQGFAEVDKCVQTCEYYAEHGSAFLSSEEIPAHFKRTWVVKKPLGIILAIMPWNFPLWQVIRCAIPALLAGNVIVLKHAPSVQGFAEWLEKAFLEVFKKPVLIQVALSNEQTEELIIDSRISAVSFTGSTNTGRKVAAIAGSFLKKCVLELGGSDPYLILEDADLDKAIEMSVKARFINGGQSCIAGKRFFIHHKVYDQFREGVLAKVKALVVGTPLDEKTEIGPMAEDRFRTQVMEQLLKSQQQGANVLCGGTILTGSGFFMEPTLVESVSAEMPLYKEEVFGPVMPLIKVENEAEAIFRANQSTFGLGSAIFSKDQQKAWKIAVENMHSGFVAINGIVSSDPRVPFGGIKNSGFGRELGIYGLHEFLNIKTIGIN